MGGTPAGTTSEVPIAQIKNLQPEAIAVAGDGTLFFTDCLAHRIYVVDGSGRVQSLGVGHGDLNNGFAGDGGPATTASYSCPAGLAFDPNGNLYIDDHANNRVRAVDARGIVTTVAGSGPAGVNLGTYAGDGGPATRARLSEPIGIAFDRHGDLFIADRDNAAVRTVGIDGIISTIAGTGVTGFSGDGDVATKAELSDPEYLVVDRRGNVYFTDQINERIRRIDTHGVITTIAGTGTAGDGGDGGPATSAQLNGPYGLAIDAAGDLFVSDSMSARVRMIDTSGRITTVAGTGVPGYTGDGGPATLAALNEPAGLAVDDAGNLYIADAGNGAIRMVDTRGIITTVVRS
ncbi:MAG TPA: SMP-30/gluconolactonase/LRE family protein [Actinomycetota bacterium]|nr:SMP-30/gluconolactonase/LRE family protein [Actinomycetota bacterium]